jgi:hypothetical protein
MIDRPLAPCPTCRRHVAAEPACPFCGAVLASAPAPRPVLQGRFSRAAVFAGVAGFAGATLAGCSSKSSPPEPAAQPAPTVARVIDALVPDAAIDASTRARLVGRSLSFEGSVVKGEVTIANDAGSAGDRHVAKTDDQGYFTFEDLEPGDYTLSGHGAQHSIHLDPGTNHQDFVLPKPPPHRLPNMPYGAPPARYRIV